MQTKIQTKGFDLHPAQSFVVDKGVMRINRLLKDLSKTDVQVNAVISCHHDKTPAFTSHLYLDLPNGKISSSATSRKFHQAFGESVDRILRQLRKQKTARIETRYSNKQVLKSA